MDERRLAVLVLQSGGGAGGDEHRDDLAVAERGGVHERGRALLEERVQPLAFRFRRRLIKRCVVLSVQPGNLLHKPFRRLRQRVDGRAGIEQDPNSVGGADDEFYTIKRIGGEVRDRWRFLGVKRLIELYRTLPRRPDCRPASCCAMPAPSRPRAIRGRAILPRSARALR